MEVEVLVDKKSVYHAPAGSDAAAAIAAKGLTPAQWAELIAGILAVILRIFVPPTPAAALPGK